VRPGFGQIVLIIIIACGVLLLARSSKRGTAKSASRKTHTRQLNPASTEEPAAMTVRQKRLRWLGIILIVAGMVALGILLSSIINFIFVLSAVAGIIILSGIAFIILSARR